MYYGCKKEIDDKRDYKMYVTTTKSAHYPEMYEISTTNVKDQGIVNSCVAHTLASFLEETYKDQDLRFSIGFIYGYRPAGYVIEEGMYPRDAMKTLLKVGDCLKADFDYNREMPQIKLLVDGNLEKLRPLAEKYKIKSYARIYSKDEILKCLYNDITVPISIPIYNDLAIDKFSKIVKMPEGKCEGYHMILLVGYNKHGYIFQNSWGKDWAENGRAILPYDYPIDTAWAISTETNAVYTYTTLWQKIYLLFLKILTKFKN